MADEVRLIDANALKEDFMNDYHNYIMESLRGNYHDTIRISEVIERIEDAPTIEAELDNGWISVKDKLPEPHENVLVFGDFNDIVNYQVDYLDGYGRWFRSFYVTHWKPLPEPPKEVENETD